MNDQPDPAALLAQRRDLIAAIEKERGSRIITYFLSDRQHANAQIADDAVRPMYDHLRGIGDAAKIDLFLFSAGGALEAPWRIVTMVREFTGGFGVLVPYRAMSAATLIALGADEVVMGRKGEIGPIDPQTAGSRPQHGVDHVVVGTGTAGARTIIGRRNMSRPPGGTLPLGEYIGHHRRNSSGNVITG